MTSNLKKCQHREQTFDRRNSLVRQMKRKHSPHAAKPSVMPEPEPAVSPPRCHVLKPAVSALSHKHSSHIRPCVALSIPWLIVSIAAFILFIASIPCCSLSLDKKAALSVRTSGLCKPLCRRFFIPVFHGSQLFE